MSSVPGAFAVDLRRYAPATRRLRAAAQRYVDAQGLEAVATVAASWCAAVSEGTACGALCCGLRAEAARPEAEAAEPKPKPIADEAAGLHEGSESAMAWEAVLRLAAAGLRGVELAVSAMAAPPCM